MSKAAVSDPHEEEVYSKTLFGFWIYLLTDFMMFAVFFATYIVLYSGTARELFYVPAALVQTLLLLTVAFVSGLAGVALHRGQKRQVLYLFGLTFLLGAAFLTMEVGELHRLTLSGNSWATSAFLSAFFTLVGTHALHVVIGLLWTVVLLIPVCRDGLTSQSIRRLSCLKMFWQFLNLVWIFIFSIVYLLGGGHA